MRARVRAPGARAGHRALGLLLSAALAAHAAPLSAAPVHAVPAQAVPSHTVLSHAGPVSPPLTLSLSLPEGRGENDSGTGLLVSTVLGVRAPSAGPGDRARTALWGWPLVGTPEIVRGFDPPAQRWLPGHRGIDLAGVAGEAVLAVEAGVVTHSGVVAGVGTVSVTHANGLRSTYQPVSDRVGRGERVARGDRIGTLDVGGHCLLADCLHLGAVRGRDTYVDPTPLLLGAELTLLPVGGLP